MSGDQDAPGARIARARRRRGLSQSVLAGLVGRSESWLLQVKRGRRGVDSYAVLTRMAEVLRVEVEELTGPGGGDGEEGQHKSGFRGLFSPARQRNIRAARITGV